MKVVEVKEQVRLSLAKCFELVVSGVKYRLFRAAITVLIISLAAAFLTTMLTESLAALRTAAALERETWLLEKFLLLSNRISQPLTAQELTEDLADRGLELPERTKDRVNHRQEFRSWGSLSEAELKRLTDIATRQAGYQRFFDQLNEGKRRVLLGRVRGIEAFAFLQEPANFDLFGKGLAQLGMRSQFPDADLDEFKRFLADWNQTEPLRQRIIAGHARTIEQLRRDLLQDRDPKEVLAAEDPDGKLLSQLREGGFQLTEQDLQSVRKQAAMHLDAERLRGILSNERVKRGLESRRDTKLAAITDKMFLDEVRSSGGAKWLVELAEQIGQPLEMTVDRVQEVARACLAEDRMSSAKAIVQEAAGTGIGFLGFSERTLWLLVVSFLVCIVGIANAMLMSVTERFREIATMKCLGATDGFIMINFILESCMQGIAGGLIGAVLGFLLGAMRSWWKYGWMAMQNFPLWEVLTAAGLSVVVGIIISALAAVYPAWVAARLAPMEAMRIE